MIISRLELLIGIALVSWGSTGIAKALGLTGWHQFDVILFASGIILLAHVPNRSLYRRIRDLEKGRIPTNPLALPAQV